jgi:hypothetical protein
LILLRSVAAETESNLTSAAVAVAAQRRRKLRTGRTDLMASNSTVDMCVPLIVSPCRLVSGAERWELRTWDRGCAEQKLDLVLAVPCDELTAATSIARVHVTSIARPPG